MFQFVFVPHLDCPPLSSMFQFKEDFIFKIGVEYICKLFNKPNGDVLITINADKDNLKLYCSHNELNILKKYCM